MLLNSKFKTDFYDFLSENFLRQQNEGKNKDFDFWNHFKGPKLFSDVLLRTSEGQVFQCHSLILASALNRDFRNILKSVWDTEGSEIEVILPDFGAEDTITFLEFIYGVDRKQDLKPTNDWYQFFDHSLAVKPDVEDIVDKVEPLFNEDDEMSGYQEDLLDQMDDHQGDYFEDHGDEIVKEEEEEETVKVEEDDDKLNVHTTSVLSSPIKSKAKPIVIGLMNHKAKIWNCLAQKCEESHKFPDLWSHIRADHKATINYLSYTCEKCGESFKKKKDFLIHLFGTIASINCSCVERREEMLRFQCQECPSRFMGARNLEVHVNIQHLNLSQRTLKQKWCSFYCEICWKYFQSLELQMEHQEHSHQIRRDHFVEDFDQAFEKFRLEQSGTKREEEVVSKDVMPKKEMKKNAKFFCSTCNKYYKSEAGLQHHMQLYHEQEQKVRCKKCGRTDFPTKFVMFQHKRRCGRDFPCTICGDKYTKLGLVSHMTLVHNDKHKLHEKVTAEDGKIRFKCDICEKHFPTNQAANRHKDGVHSKNGPKKYNCDAEGCTYKTNVRENFYGHQKTHADLNHVCEHCGMLYSNPVNLRRHTQVHHSNETLLCTECPKTFSNQVSLRRHMRIHGEAKLECLECGKAFKTHTSFSQHRKTHSTERPFPCGICGKAFKMKQKMKRHEKIHLKIKKRDLD